MDHGGGTHGPRQDDALKRETRSEVQANRQTRVEEWREPEPPGEDQPAATWPLRGRPGGVPAGETPDGVQLRSDLARHLDRQAFPAGRAGLLRTLADHNAPDWLMEMAGSLPEDATFAGLTEVVHALGLPSEARRRRP
jgi:uncharacterized protein DUF2795